MDAYKSLKAAFPDLGLILVPRHAERRSEVEAEIRARGLTHVRRSVLDSTGEPGGDGLDVLLVDTTGELRSFYACATVIFVGKSLTRHGGQNVIEPALFGKAIVVGPNMENFPVVASDMLQARALLQVKDSAGLEEALGSLLGDRDLREGYGERARGLLREKRGAVERSVESMARVLGARNAD
jgi:3-deoxy-D-manno-octulosonic-acid transferase